MERRHFELIARILRDCDLTIDDRKTLALCFCDALQETNPKFNRDKFIAAVCDETERARSQLKTKGWTRLG